MDWQPITTVPATVPDLMCHSGNRILADSWPEGFEPSCSRGAAYWAPWPEDGWLPIETAPHDGTQVLLKCDPNPHHEWPGIYGYGAYIDLNAEAGYRGPPQWTWTRTCANPPTHWQPLPSPPTPENTP